MVKVKATGSGQSVEGESGHAQANERDLRALAAVFATHLAKLKQLENYTIFNCAEVQAVARALQAGIPLSEIRIQKALFDEHIIYTPCKNCAQWLEEVASRVYRIKPDLAGVQAAAQTVPDMSSLSDFPPLGK